MSEKPLFRCHKRNTVHRGNWLDLHIDKVEMPNGSFVEEFHLIEFHHKAAAAVVTDQQGRILLEKSYRYSLNGTAWEIPAGGIDKGETPVEAAEREVREETGYQTVNHKVIYEFCPLVGVSPHVFYLVSCNAEGHPLHEPDPAEVQQIQWFSPDEVRRMIGGNEILDGFSLTGLLFHFSNL